MTKPFTSRFSSTLINQLKLIYPEISDERLHSIVSAQCKSKLVNPPVKLENKILSLLQFIHYMEVEEPIISGYGTLYKQHKEMSSLLYIMIEDLGLLRNDAKADMFGHLNDKDPTMKMMFNTIQLTYKLLMNSLYGATIEKNSFFFNPDFGPSVTYTGVVIITTSLNVFEKFMSNNFHFRKLTDLTTYVNNIINEEYNPYDYVTDDISDKILIDYLYNKLDNHTENQLGVIKKIVTNLTDEQRLKVYLKNNIYEVIDRSPKIQKYLKDILGNNDLLDPNEPPEKYIDGLSNVWSMLNILVHYDYLDFYRQENADYGERKTILTVNILAVIKFL